MMNFNNSEVSEEYNICVSEDACSCVLYSAKQLKNYIYKITGKNLGIVSHGDAIFYIGTTNDFPDNNILNQDICSKIKNDGFAIYTVNNKIVITAIDKRGVAYGVYEYLEKNYGVRFLTCSFEYVPDCKYIVYPEKAEISNPDFQMRGYFIGDENDEKYIRDEADFDFVVKSRVKDVFLKIPDEYGGESNVYGRNYLHNFHYYVPFEIYGNKHPEWYRFFYVNKEIIPTIDITDGITDDGKLDETVNESVAKIVIKSIIEDAVNHPDKDIFNFTQEDGEYFFESDRTKYYTERYKHSGVLVRFCNVVLREVNKYLKNNYNRTIKIITFAYSYAKNAPVKYLNNNIVPIDDTVVADENLIIQLALFQNGIYSYFSDKQDVEVQRIMKEWKVVAKDFWFWMYDINFHKYLYYYDSFSVIKDNLKGFKKYGISSLAINGPPEEGFNWHANLRSYVYRKMMWNIDDDPEQRINEYIDLYYGVAGPCVKEMMNIYHKNTLKCMEDPKYKVITRGSSESAVYNPKEMLLSALKEIEKGETAINNAGYNNDEKELYLRHLMAVKATPLLMLYDMFYYHNPDGQLKDYIDLRSKFFETARKGKVHFSGEHWSLDQFEKECMDNDRKLNRIL